MIFLSEHSPSIKAKVIMSLGVLAGTLTATALTTGYSDWFMNVLNFEKVEGNIYRQIVMFIYFNTVCLCISMGMVVYFIAIEIPLLDEHINKKYKLEFTKYYSATQKFVPFIY